MIFICICINICIYSHNTALCEARWFLQTREPTTAHAYTRRRSRFKPWRCIQASFYIPENRLNFPITKGFRTKISMKLVYQYMTIFFTFSPTSNHLHPLQVENCDSNSRLVVEEDDNGKFRLQRAKPWLTLEQPSWSWDAWPTPHP